MQRTAAAKEVVHGGNDGRQQQRQRRLVIAWAGGAKGEKNLVAALLERWGLEVVAQRR